MVHGNGQMSVIGGLLKDHRDNVAVWSSELEAKDASSVSVLQQGLGHFVDVGESDIVVHWSITSLHSGNANIARIAEAVKKSSASHFVYRCYRGIGTGLCLECIIIFSKNRGRRHTFHVLNTFIHIPLVAQDLANEGTIIVHGVPFRAAQNADDIGRAMRDDVLKHGLIV